MNIYISDHITKFDQNFNRIILIDFKFCWDANHKHLEV